MIKLAVNTGFLVNRYPRPADWASVINDLGVKNVQLTTDLFSPYYTDLILERQANEIAELASRYGFSISSVFTGGFTRVNHFCHPDYEIRQYWLNWFERLARFSQIFSCKRIGSHIGIMSIPDDLYSRRETQERCVNYWKQLSNRVRQYGVTELTWEHMSISREQGHTMEDIDLLLNHFSDLESIRLCLDPDHGDLSSSNQKDYEPYGLISKYLPYSSQIHLKQISPDKRKNSSFTKEHNQNGLIQAERVLSLFKDVVDSSSASDFEFILELNAREREPDDSSIVSQVSESLVYWRNSLDAAGMKYE